MRYVVHIKRSYEIEAPSEDDAAVRALEKDEQSPDRERQYVVVDAIELVSEAERVG